jgi:hypothetical protein
MNKVEGQMRDGWRGMVGISGGGGGVEKEGVGWMRGG